MEGAMVRRNGVTLTEGIIVFSIIVILGLMIASIGYDNVYRPKEAAAQPALSLDELSNFDYLVEAESFNDEYSVVKFATNQMRSSYNGKIWTNYTVYEWLHLDVEAYGYMKARKGQNTQTVLGYWKTERERAKQSAGAAEK